MEGLQQVILRDVSVRNLVEQRALLDPTLADGVPALDRMERRIYADHSLMRIRRCTVEHPFGTFKRMSGGGRFLTRGLRKVKAEAALSVLAFNILHAANALGARKLSRAG